MGLLDQILGNVVGGALGQRPSSPSSGGLGGAFGSGLGGGLGGGRSGLLMALLPVVLGMLANRQQGGGGGLGGLGGLAGGLGGLFGGNAGGLGGLLSRLSGSGYGQQVQSWVSTGQNQALPAEAIDGLFSPDQLQALAAHAGASEDEVRGGLAELLPEVVDHLTPQGQLPDQEQLLSSIDDFQRRLQG